MSGFGHIKHTHTVPKLTAEDSRCNCSDCYGPAVDGKFKGASNPNLAQEQLPVDHAEKPVDVPAQR